jgi:hypothetical protein
VYRTAKSLLVLAKGRAGGGGQPAANSVQGD